MRSAGLRKGYPDNSPICGRAGAVGWGRRRAGGERHPARTCRLGLARLRFASFVVRPACEHPAEPAVRAGGSDPLPLWLPSFGRSRLFGEGRGGFAALGDLVAVVHNVPPGGLGHIRTAVPGTLRHKPRPIFNEAQCSPLLVGDLRARRPV